MCTARAGARNTLRGGRGKFRSFVAIAGLHCREIGSGPSERIESEHLSAPPHDGNEPNMLDAAVSVEGPLCRNGLKLNARRVKSRRREV